MRYVAIEFIIVDADDEQEPIRADTDQALSFKELVSAWQRITRPTAIEEVPLSVDPDDYPVV